MDDSKLTKEWIGLAIKEKGSLAELKKLMDIHSTDRTSELVPLAGKLIDNCRKHSLYELELFVRKLRVQHYLFYADDPGEVLEKCLDDVATAHLPQITDSEIKHCIIDNLLAAYSRMDALVHAEKIMNLAQEQLQLLKPGTQCYSCHERYVVNSLVHMQRYEQARKVVDESPAPNDDIKARYDKLKQKADIHQALAEFETSYEYVKNCETIFKAHEDELSVFRRQRLYYTKATIEANLNQHKEAVQTLLRVKESWYNPRWLEYFLECVSALDSDARSGLDQLDRNLIERAYDLCIKRRLSRSAFNINCHLLTILLSENREMEARAVFERLEALATNVTLRENDHGKIRNLKERLGLPS